MWTFTLPHGPRLQALLEPCSFEQITERIVQRAVRVGCVCRHEEPCQRKPGHFRAVYCLDIQASLFDAFFNSENGYRAQYFADEHTGYAANADLIASLRPMLLQSGPLPDGGHIDPAASLQGGSGKVWLAEETKKLCGSCGEWVPPSDGPPDILNGRWETVDYVYAKYGRRAPYLTKLRIFGAFVSPGGDEFVPPDKEHRARHIHDWGWS